jgi:acyl-CoA thioester hydrolase
MFKLTINPRFLETDALGHINHTVIPMWFESGREPLFRLFNPKLNVKAWNLIMAKIEISFNQQIFFGKPVDIHTYIKKIRNTSIIIRQEVWQAEELCAIGEIINIHFNHQTQKAIRIPPKIRGELEKHLYEHI